MIEITRKSLLTLHYSELAWMKQSKAGINAHDLLENSVIYALRFRSWFFSTANHL